MSALLVLTTVGTEEEASRIARALVCRRHAACVNVVPGVKSTYRWQDKVCSDTEFLLVVKTEESEYAGVEAAIRELHSYELPEILALSADRGEASFLAWIASSVDKTRASGCSEDDELEEPPISLDETNY
ncbi:MAG TPA: divalent-cation tolerance protein CutA [Thermoanaerobaculia bacterium]|nr:divalent-cation tolerance protein CutA [Thermoanaerobaculia bacterium]